MIERIEKVLRTLAQKVRFGAQKRKAQRERLEKSQAYAALDSASKKMSDLSVGDEKRTYDIQRMRLQRQAESQGLLKEGERGYSFENKEVDRNDRPAERLVQGDVDGEKWDRLNKGSKMDARAMQFYARQFYEQVLDGTYMKGLEEAGYSKQEQLLQSGKQIQEGIRTGWIEQDGKGNHKLREKMPEHDRPGEKLVMGRIKEKKRSRGMSR